MITVEGVSGRSITVIGHAGYGAYGQDIVCAAASVLTYTVAEAVLKMYKDGYLKRYPTVRLDSGNSAVYAEPKTRYMREAKTVFDTVAGGFTALAKAYPNYLEVHYDR